MEEAYRYCTTCATPLVHRLIDGRQRPVCPGCGRVVYLDPKLAACCIPWLEESLLLVRRAIEPGYGLWTFPGGYVELGETVPQAALRETWEEASLRVSLGPLLGVYSYPGRPAVVIVYPGQVVEGHPLPNSECLEARYFLPNELPWEELAFPSTRDALGDFLRGRPTP